MEWLHENKEEFRETRCKVARLEELPPLCKRFK